MRDTYRAKPQKASSTTPRRGSPRSAGRSNVHGEEARPASRAARSVLRHSKEPVALPLPATLVVPAPGGSGSRSRSRGGAPVHIDHRRASSLDIVRRAPSTPHSKHSLESTKRLMHHVHRHSIDAGPKEGQGERPHPWHMLFLLDSSFSAMGRSGVRALRNGMCGIWPRSQLQLQPAQPTDRRTLLGRSSTCQTQRRTLDRVPRCVKAQTNTVGAVPPPPLHR
ncbi:hypothetical protein C8Q78DRAFT_54317 [Trametes maxima]|nr:hypothetical protein C8Q78DRAFT_54317 [Trametes maxima]